MKIQYTILYMNKGQHVISNVNGASLPRFQRGNCNKMWSKVAPANRFGLAWLAQFRNGIEQ